MDDAQPISYEALAKGTPALSAGGARFGTVEHVLHDDSLDLFDGVVVTTSAGLRFVDAAKVTSITTVALGTSLSDDEVAALPMPDGTDVFHVDALQDVGDSLTAHLGRLFRREHWKADK
jgi:hypothetical protein